MKYHMCNSPLRAAEFFAGMGLVRSALEQSGFEIVFANDISPIKQALYVSNFPGEDFRLGDIREMSGQHVPDVDLMTASFPCTDLSVAGGRAGLAGPESGMFWEFARVLEEMGRRRPPAILLENVLGFATSSGGRDLEAAVAELNALGYSCDILVGDAKWFLPQSRPRLFIVGLTTVPEIQNWYPARFRPEWVGRYRSTHFARQWHSYPLSLPPIETPQLSDVVERLPATDTRWWDRERVGDFTKTLSPVQLDRVEAMIDSELFQWRTAYRRTRRGSAVWEVRRDNIAGCLRTARGGSSKQALVEAGMGEIRVRWLTPREYARLQGADEFRLDAVTPNQALYGLGDAVCVPVVRWIADSYLRPVLTSASRRAGASV